MLLGGNILHTSTAVPIVGVDPQEYSFGMGKTALRPLNPGKVLNDIESSY